MNYKKIIFAELKAAAKRFLKTFFSRPTMREMFVPVAIVQDIFSGVKPSQK